MSLASGGGSGIFGGAEERVASAHALLQASYEARLPEHDQFRLAASCLRLRARAAQ